MRPTALHLRTSSVDAQKLRQHVGTVVLRDGAGDPCAHGGELARGYWVRVPERGSFELSIDRAEVLASFSTKTSGERVLNGYYGTALPLFTQAALGYEVLHASAVLVDGAAVAFCARTGVGKTTIAVALAERGHELWADDAVALSAPESEAPLSVFLPFLRNGEVVSPPAGVEEVPLAAVFLLERRGDGEDVNASDIRQPSAGEAVAGLVSHAYRFAPQSLERRREMLKTYLDIVARVPVLLVRVAPDPDRLPELLDRIEAKLRTRIVARG